MTTIERLYEFVSICSEYRNKNRFNKRFDEFVKRRCEELQIEENFTTIRDDMLRAVRLLVDTQETEATNLNDPRFPFTYAADFIRCIMENATGDKIISRAQASNIWNFMADRLDYCERDFAIILSDIFKLELHNKDFSQAKPKQYDILMCHSGLIGLCTGYGRSGFVGVRLYPKLSERNGRLDWESTDPKVVFPLSRFMEK